MLKTARFSRSLLGLRVTLAALLLPLLVTACGGGGSTTTASGTATISAAGGTVDGLEGTQVVIPAGAMSAEATIRIAKDSTNMPALPDYVTAVGSAWQVTPHGASFTEPVQVVLPAPTRALAANEELRVAKVSPGGQWELLTPEANGDTLSVNVQSFSYFVPVVLTYQATVQSVPALALQPSTYTCNGGPCLQILPDSASMEFTVSSNQGEVPQGCTNPQLRIGASGDIVLGDTTPMAWVPNRTVASYSYSFNVATNSPTGTPVAIRNGRSGEVSVQLLCNPSTATESRITMTSVPVRFPAKSLSATGSSVEAPPSFSISTESVTCNGGPCMDLIGPQDVRLTVAVAPGSILPAGCTAPLTLIVKTNANQPVLAETDEVPAAGSPLSTGGGSFVFHNRTANTYGYFRVNPPVPARAQTLFYGGKCGNGQLFNGGSVTLNFVAAQQGTAPVFTMQPTSMTVREGQTASFTAVASGFGTPTLQWYSRADATANWVAVNGATSATLTTAATTLADNGRQYKLIATNTLGSVDSVVVTLTVNVNDLAPIITTQPATLNVVDGSDATFAVVATGTGGLNYQWYRAGNAIVGANGSVLNLAAVGSAQAGGYTVQISNGSGSVTSQTAQLVVSTATPTATAPSIVTQPVAVTVNAGNTATFAVGVSGTGPFTYQWQKDGQPISGATSAFHSIASAAAGDAGTYSVQVSNSAGTATSNGAALTVNANPVVSAVSITTQPSPQVQLPGGSATFAVAATGTGPFTYQWLKDGAPISGATNAVLLLSNLQASDAAVYSVTVSNSLGGVTSDAASLTVVGAPAITSQPASTSANEGGTATFSVAATGSNLRYQWTRDNVGISGATSASYTTPTLALADNGATYGVIVYNGAGIVFSQSAVLSVVALPPISAADKIAAGLNHTCAIGQYNALYCWGNNPNGELGNGSTTYRADPTPVSVLGAVKSVAAGSWSTCAIDSNDALWCWGSMGDVVPTQLSPTGVRVSSVSLGSDHGCYVDDSGQVFCWGNTTFGKRGDLNPPADGSPNPVLRADDSLLSNALSVSVGVNHSCALQTDGAVWCWGADVAYAVHVTATRVMRRLPDNSLMDFTATKLVAGRYHTCAIESSSGQPMCWGNNNWGQLGDGTLIARDEAKPVNLTGVLQLAAGYQSTCAISSNAMTCWGNGFMGNGGGFAQQLSPVAVSAYTDSADPPQAAAIGEKHTCALRTSGDVQCWGWNNAGQAGIGSVSDTINVLVPTSTTLGASFWRP